MRLKFYSNENFHLGAVEQLRSLGYDVLTSLDAGRANQRIPDEQVLEFARQESRAVLTFNRLHFVRLHKQSAIHHGILVCAGKKGAHFGVPAPTPARVHAGRPHSGHS